MDAVSVVATVAVMLSIVVLLLWMSCCIFNPMQAQRMSDYARSVRDDAEDSSKRLRHLRQAFRLSELAEQAKVSTMWQVRQQGFRNRVAQLPPELQSMIEPGLVAQIACSAGSRSAAIFVKSASWIPEFDGVGLLHWCEVHNIPRAVDICTAIKPYLLDVFVAALLSPDTSILGAALPSPLREAIGTLPCDEAPVAPDPTFVQVQTSLRVAQRDHSDLTLLYGFLEKRPMIQPPKNSPLLPLLGSCIPVPEHAQESSGAYSRVAEVCPFKFVRYAGWTSLYSEMHSSGHMHFRDVRQISSCRDRGEQHLTSVVFACERNGASARVTSVTFLSSCWTKIEIATSHMCI